MPGFLSDRHTLFLMTWYLVLGRWACRSQDDFGNRDVGLLIFQTRSRQAIGAHGRRRRYHFSGKHDPLHNSNRGYCFSGASNSSILEVPVAEGIDVISIARLTEVRASITDCRWRNVGLSAHLMF
ncbi:hypothetical protein DAEQUDRAFT_10470 [Daedalea quercina L-15889]|uniref:Secreted protein n=1 Tax=Daedalea quercina L-15889 TaxID=1314783 RepID=A0A165UG52_9APHY|nr:hypothetical protein DAEQUDRAFT_10470 [Daedalea quercina L-15889]